MILSDEIGRMVHAFSDEERKLRVRRIAHGVKELEIAFDKARSEVTRLREAGTILVAVTQCTHPNSGDCIAIGRQRDMYCTSCDARDDMRVALMNPASQ